MAVYTETLTPPMTTISIGGNTVPTPTEIQEYAPDDFTKHYTIGGHVRIQKNSNTDQTGEKSGIRRMFWNMLPSSSADWDLSVSELKALAGTDTTLQASNIAANFYLFATNIRIHEVNIKPIGRGTLDNYEVEILYSHR